MAMVRVMIAEDQSMVLGALAALLGLEDDIEVLATVANGEDALAQIEEHSPDVLITDIEMPGISGLEVARRLHEVDSPVKILILTTFARSGYLKRAMDAGVRGYMLKDGPSEELALAIRRIAAGRRVIDPELAAEAWGADDPLTERERAVLSLAGEALTSGQIAERLFLAEGTVRNYLSEAIGKLGARNRMEAVQTARERGLL